LYVSLPEKKRPFICGKREDEIRPDANYRVKLVAFSGNFGPGNELVFEIFWDGTKKVMYSSPTPSQPTHI
jgi:hypothetical protein